MKNCSPLKRKGFRIDIDIEDNYQSQKRFVSEQMALELGYLSISPPNEVKFRMNSTHHTKTTPKKAHTSHSRFPSTFKHHARSTNNNNNFTQQNNNNTNEFYFGTETRHTNNNNNMFFSSLENLQSLLSGDSNQNHKNKNLKFVLNLDPHPTIINEQSYTQDTTMEDSHNSTTVYRKALINRLFIDPLNNHFIPLPPAPDNSKALVVYKPSAQVIIESILRSQQKKIEQQRQKDNLVFIKTMEELEENMSDFYIEDMEYIEIL